MASVELQIYRATFALNGLGIKRGEWCIVGGGVLAAHGIRECGDIDIILADRRAYGDGAVKLCDGVDLVRVGYTRGGVSDAEIIADPQYHTLYCGAKVASLDLVYERKKISVRDKDKRDVALIEGYYGR